ncbi:hypothetical protein DPSP01_010065 [Paraphaeosphaeria sporulosa]
MNAIQLSHHAGSCIGHCRAQRHEMDCHDDGVVEASTSHIEHVQVEQKEKFVLPIALEERWEGTCHVPLQMDSRIDSK